MDTLEQEELDFQPFLFLGSELLGAEITDAVDRQMLTGAECDHLRNRLASDDEVASLAASRFYESIRNAAILAAGAAGPGIVACCGRAFYFVKAADWNCNCDVDVAALVESSEADMGPLAVLECARGASVVRLGANRVRAIMGLCWAGGEIGGPEVSTRGLQHLLEHY